VKKKKPSVLQGVRVFFQVLRSEKLIHGHKNILSALPSKFLTGRKENQFWLLKWGFFRL
jgi:hypothetical protein